MQGKTVNREPAHLNPEALNFEPLLLNIDRHARGRRLGRCFFFDEVDGVLHGGNAFGGFVRNFNIEFLF